MARRTLPPDSALLPIREGALLVSRSWAVFCRVPAEQVDAVRTVLGNGRAAAALPGDLQEALHTHGFFGGPRAPEAGTRSVQIQLTNECNLACSYCCTNSRVPRTSEVQRDQMFALVDDLRTELGAGGNVSLLGGEPFLVPWAIDLAERIIALGLRLTIFTNGTFFAGDADLARRLAALTRRDTTVRVSLGGPNAALCDAISKGPRFDTVIAGINRIAELGGHVKVDLLLIPVHVEAVVSEFPALRRRLPAGTPIALGITYVSGRETGRNVFASRATLEAVLDRVAFEAGELISAPETSPTAPRRDGCSCALGDHLHVRSDGALFSCFKMEEQVGDLAQDAFRAVAKQVRAAPHRADALQPCNTCELASLCGGGCRSENQLYTGDAETPICGPWRVQVLSELLAENRVTAIEWPATHLHAEAVRRGIDAPVALVPAGVSRHLVDT